MQSKGFSEFFTAKFGGIKTWYIYQVLINSFNRDLEYIPGPDPIPALTNKRPTHNGIIKVMIKESTEKVLSRNFRCRCHRKIDK